MPPIKTAIEVSLDNDGDDEAALINQMRHPEVGILSQR